VALYDAERQLIPRIAAVPAEMSRTVSQGQGTKALRETHHKTGAMIAQIGQRKSPTEAGLGCVV